MLSRLVFALLLLVSLPPQAAGAVAPAHAPGEGVVAVEFVEALALPSSAGAFHLPGLERAPAGGSGSGSAAPGSTDCRLRCAPGDPLTRSGPHAHGADRAIPLCERLPYHATAPPIGR